MPTMMRSDKPINIDPDNVFGSDKLGFQDSIVRLSGILDNLEAPFTLGVFGPWGTGKTSFINLLATHRKNENRNHKTFIFNAWQYENEESLMLPLLCKLSGTFLLENETWAKVKKIATAVTLLGTSGFLKTISANLLSIEDVQKSLDDAENATKTAYEMWTSCVDELQDEFSKIVNQIVKDTGQPLMIFIDDLDRCLPENVVKIIENIKHFFSVENCVFIITVDKKVITKGIMARYGSNLISGEEYLEKIINFSFFIPEPKNGYGDYVWSRIEEIANEGFIRNNKAIIENFCSFIDSSNLNNPRRINMLINRVWMYLSSEERDQYLSSVVFRLILIREFYEEVYMVMRDVYKSATPKVKYAENAKTPLEQHQSLLSLTSESFVEFFNDANLRKLLSGGPAPDAFLVSRFGVGRDQLIREIESRPNKDEKKHHLGIVAAGVHLDDKPYFDYLDFLFCFS